MIRNEKDAEKVLSDLSIFSYAFGLLLILPSIFYFKHIIIFPIIFLFAGYFLPRRKSRVISLVALILSIILSAIAIWCFFLHANSPLFGLGLGVMSIFFSLIVLLIPLFVFFYSWVAFRNTMATFIYHLHYSQFKKVSSSDKTSSLT
jgi:hypothetical protein